MKVATHFGSTAVLALLLIASTSTAAPIPFAGAAGINAMERARAISYCATCHLDEPAPQLVWGGRMGVSLVSPFRPNNPCSECHYQDIPPGNPTNITRTGTIVGGRALPSSLWRYKK